MLLGLKKNSIKPLPPPNEGIIAIEFKLGYEVSEWEKDVEKLLHFDKVKILCRMFCVLLTDKLGVAPEANTRIFEFSTNPRPQGYVKHIKFDNFPSGGPRKQCIVGIWEVK
jgi:hypothetical protein